MKRIAEFIQKLRKSKSDEVKEETKKIEFKPIKGWDELVDFIKEHGGKTNPCSNSDLKTLENWIGLKLDDEIKKYLLKIGDADLKYYETFGMKNGKNSTMIDSIGELSILYKDSTEKELPKHYLPICDLYGGSGIFLMYSIKNHKTYVLDFKDPDELLYAFEYPKLLEAVYRFAIHGFDL